MTIKPVVKNILAVIIGIVIGGIVNMLLVNIGPSVIPLPHGADVSTMDKLSESMKLFSPVNFIFPFLAHALGTLVGAYIAAKFSASNHVKLAMLIGIFFLIGGIAAVNMLGGPMWFNITDLVLAYIPMAFLGAALAGRLRSKAV